jgi:hypothetical protein
MPTRHPMTTLAATSSEPNSETLATREVLSHPYTVFHTCTYGLCGGVAAVVVALISYDDMGLLLR